MNRRAALLLALTMGLDFLQVMPARSEDDPLTVQAQASQQIENFVELFRRTGNSRLEFGDLQQADRDLERSNKTLEARGDWKALSVGLVKRGNARRLQSDWDSAIALYRQAVDVAARGGNLGYQADALSYMALAESLRGNLVTALAEAREAARLAESSENWDALARALEIVVTTLAAQGDLAGALALFDQSLAAANRAKDSMALFYVYSDRADVYYKTAAKCDYRQAFNACNQALDRERADFEQAAAIAHSKGYVGLVLQINKFIRDLEARRQLFNAQHESR